MPAATLSGIVHPVEFDRLVRYDQTVGLVRIMAALSFKQNRANRRHARSFESLVQAGLAVIAVRGLYETTVEHITEAADVGKGTFYAHFPSKEDLVHHLVRLGFGELIAAGRAKVSSGSAATDRLAALIRAQLRVLDRRRDLVISSCCIKRGVC